MSLLCFLRIHKYGEIKPDPLQMGVHVLFWTWASQTGEKTCERCGKVQKLSRAGLYGVGGDNPPWRKTN